MPLNRTATRSDVEAIAGHLDDSRVAEILAAKATVAELLEARQWLISDDSVTQHAPRQPSARVGRLTDILGADQPDPDEI